MKGDPLEPKSLQERMIRDFCISISQNAFKVNSPSVRVSVKP